MLLKQLKYFTEVITCQSFTVAAEKCCISQSAISQQIRALEENLGVELIRRKNRKFSMTPAGEYFYRHGLVLLDEAKRLKKETIRIGSQKDERLRVGYLKCLGGREFCQTAAVFSEKYPALELETSVGDHETLSDMLCFGGTDVILSDQRMDGFEEYEYIPLATAGYSIEISARSVLSALEYVNLENLRKIPCILTAPRNHREREKEYYANTLGLNDNFLFADTIEEGRIMAAGDKGFLLIEEIGKDFGQDENVLCRIPLCRDGKRIKTDYCVLWKKERTNVYIKEFAEILHREFQEAEPMNLQNGNLQQISFV